MLIVILMYCNVTWYRFNVSRKFEAPLGGCGASTPRAPWEGFAPQPPPPQRRGRTLNVGHDTCAMALVHSQACTTAKLILALDTNINEKRMYVLVMRHWY